MWWYGTGWWWWWLGILVLFFLLPLGYGWAKRGRGSWYRRRPSRRGAIRSDALEPMRADYDSRWGWLGVLLWIVLVLEVIWLAAVWGWGPVGRHPI